MNILYFGTACDKVFEKEITEITKATYTIAQNNLERALLEGWYDNKIENLKLNCLPVMQYDVLSPGFFVKSEVRNINSNLRTKTFPIMKIRIIKEIIIILITFIRIINWYFRVKNNEKKIVFSAINYTPVTLTVYILSKILRFENISMLCDLSQDTYSVQRGKDKENLKSSVMRIYLMLVKKIETGFDKYIFLTEPMNRIVNKYNKPYIVVEGIYNNDLNYDNFKRKTPEKTLIYSGSLFLDYGIDVVLDSFKLIKDPSIELHIYGSGVLDELVKKNQEEDKRIKYFGFISREELFEKLKSATLLLNLRDPSLSYTKYSFPSKTFEYLASGTPILTTRLAGIPHEYYKFMYTVDVYDVKTISEKISEICEIDLESRIEFGEEARRFVLENKTQNSQIQKTLRLLFL